MKKISFRLAAFLVVLLAVGSAFENSKGKSLPITGWYAVISNSVAPGVPASPSSPLSNPVYDPAKFEPGATDHALLDCGSIEAKVCAAYFRASDEVNIQCPPAEGMVYFLSGGRQ